MKIKLMIAAVIACLVFTGFTKENVSDTVDHNYGAQNEAYKTIY